MKDRIPMNPLAYLLGDPMHMREGPGRSNVPAGRERAEGTPHVLCFSTLPA